MPNPKDTTDAKAFSDLKVERFAHGGVGVARTASGQVCFIPKTAPGDRVEANLVRMKKRFATLELVRIIEPSPERVAAPCPYFLHCSGCAYQHLRDADQVKAKAQVLDETLARYLPGRSFVTEPVVAAQQTTWYRNRISLHLERGALGFVDSVLSQHVPIERCLLATATIHEMLDKVQPWLHGSGQALAPFIENVTLRSSAHQNMGMAILVTRAGAEAAFMRSQKAQIAHHRSLVDLAHAMEGHSLYVSLRHVEAGTPVQVLAHVAGPRYLEEKIGPYVLRISPDAFFQNHRGQAEKLYRRVQAEVDRRQARSILELYSGIGALTHFLAGAGRSVLAIESNGGAVADAKSSAAHNNLSGVEFLESSVEHAASIVKSLATVFDLAVINPPRTGCTLKAIDVLARSQIKSLLYISCAPATLTRDIVALEAHGFHLHRIVPFDMFPQTWHLETLAILERT